MSETFMEEHGEALGRSPQSKTKTASKRDISVHVVEADHPSAAALASLFRTEGFLVSVFYSAAEFFDDFDRLMPDIVVANLNLHDTSGLDIPLGLRAKNALVPIFMINDNGSARESTKALMLGAYDVIDKPYDDEHLLNIVTRTIRFDFRRHILARKASIPALAELTQRELQILELTVAGDTSKEVAQKLGISHRTVEVHRTHTMMKLGARNVADLVRLVLTS